MKSLFSIMIICVCVLFTTGVSSAGDAEIRRELEA